MAVVDGCADAANQRNSGQCKSQRDIAAPSGAETSNCREQSWKQRIHRFQPENYLLHGAVPVSLVALCRAGHVIRSITSLSKVKDEATCAESGREGDGDVAARPLILIGGWVRPWDKADMRTRQSTRLWAQAGQPHVQISVAVRRLRMAEKLRRNRSRRFHGASDAGARELSRRIAKSGCRG